MGYTPTLISFLIATRKNWAAVSGSLMLAYAVMAAAKGPRSSAGVEVNAAQRAVSQLLENARSAVMLLQKRTGCSDRFRLIAAVFKVIVWEEGGRGSSC